MIIKGMEILLRIFLICLKSKLVFIPFFKAAVELSWIVGPSASGSLKGKPISYISSPDFWRFSIILVVSSKLGNPAVKYIDSIFFYLSNTWSILFITV